MLESYQLRHIPILLIILNVLDYIIVLLEEL